MARNTTENAVVNLREPLLGSAYTRGRLPGHLVNGSQRFTVARFRAPSQRPARVLLNANIRRIRARVGRIIRR